MVLTEYGQDVLLKFSDLSRDADRDEHAEALNVLRHERDSAAGELAAARREVARPPNGGDMSARCCRDVHKQFPNSPRDGARIVRQVAAEGEPQLLAVATGGRP